MLICRTPLRISFFGGGTDFPDWYKENEGMVLSSTINKYCFLTLRRLAPIFEYKYRLRYFNNEHVTTVDKIKHNSIRESLKKYHNSRNGLELIYNADLPAKTGLGSSSAFSVSLIHTLSVMNKQMISKRDLALKAIDLEQNILKEHVGSQDQFICSFGGFNSINFNNRGVQVAPIIIDEKRMQVLFDHCVLFYTKSRRYAEKVEKDKIKNLNKIKKELSQIYQITVEANKILHEKKGFIKEIGKLMNESWLLKRNLSKYVSNKNFDELYEYAMLKGALGGKLLGAGGGGFFLFIVPNKKTKFNLINSLKKKGLPNINFDIDQTGSQIIYHKDSDDF